MKTNVIVLETTNGKMVQLRDTNRDTFPWTFEVVSEAAACDHVSIHQRNCDFEYEAEQYYNLLRKD